MSLDFFSPKQMEFILNGNCRWNLAHGSVRSGKTVCTVFLFLQYVIDCPGDKFYIVGHTFDSAYRNVVQLILNDPSLCLFRPFCTWSGKKLYFRDKIITILGAKDEGSIGNFQGDTYSSVYCDEMTLYPTSIIEMINSRLSKEYSRGYAAMNPKQPSHILKSWIDRAEAGDPNYYSLHFTVEDNPYLPKSYIEILKQHSGLFYKRNYLGLWCLAEGAIFEFFDKDIYVVDRPPRAAEYWIAGIDVGTSNAFACLLIGVSTGRYTQSGKCLWIEKEYYWNSKTQHRQKTNSEYADDVQSFLEPYDVRGIYVDPSAASFKADLRKRGMHVIDADNDVENGIQYVTSEMRKGNIYVCKECKNTIREIEGYVWDPKAAERGYDEPLKKDDHTCVTGDTLVRTNQGNIRIDSLFPCEDYVMSYIYGNFDYCKVDVVRKTGKNKEIFKLTLQNGNILRATEDHKVYTARGYIEIRNLLPDDEVLCDVWERNRN